MSSRLPRRSRGFTLIELMITVAIVAILAAVALPAYKGQIARGKRSDVQSLLVEDAGYMQRYYEANNTYLSTGTGANAISPSLPNTRSPKSGNKNYDISIDSDNTSATTFKLKAVPTGSMTGDKCGTYTIDHLGQKGAGDTVAACWR
jgi:type IV pilus assembly protein PilE